MGVLVRGKAMLSEVTVSHMSSCYSLLSVSIRLSVRSRGSNGAILTLTDSKHMDFVVIRLTAGKLMMSADLGRGPASVTSSVAVNDGEWHNVRAHHTQTHTHVTS